MHTSRFYFIVYMCLSVLTHANEFLGMLVLVCVGQGLMLRIFLSLPTFFIYNFLMALEPPDLTVLTGQQALAYTHLCPSRLQAHSAAPRPAADTIKSSRFHCK